MIIMTLYVMVILIGGGLNHLESRVGTIRVKVLSSDEIYLNLALFWTVCESHIYSILLPPWL